MDINVVVIEDEHLASDRLIKLIKQYDESLNIEKILDSVKDSIEYFTNNKHPDLIFMDIQLGDGKSFDIFSSVKVNSYIIFVTAYDEYAMQAFKLNSIDYILKPIKRVELFQAIDKFKNNINNFREVKDIRIAYDQIKESEAKEHKARFLAKRGSRYFSIESKDVAYIYTKDRMHFIKTSLNIDYLIDSTLDDLETQMDPKIFYRANRQFILNYNCIDEVIIWFDGKLKILVKPLSPEEIIISRLKSSDFKQWLSK